MNIEILCYDCLCRQQSECGTRRNNAISCMKRLGYFEALLTRWANLRSERWGNT